ncbi:MAG TPA: LamG domain-containing protein, partial [Caulifigura sp.]|nr:LamG domain-containing protein [Caulifigura sp.]
MTLSFVTAVVLCASSFQAQAAANDSGNDAEVASKPVPVLSLTFDQSDELPKDAVVGKLNLKAEGPRPPQFPKTSTTNTAAEFKGGTGAGRLVIKDPGDNSPLDFKLGDTITIEAWVQPTALGNGQAMYIVGKGRTGNDGVAKDNQNYALRLAGSKDGATISFLFRGAPEDPKAKAEFHRWDSSTGFAVDGSWHHVAVLYTFGDPNSIRGFIDGEAVKGTWAGYGGPTKLGPVVDNDEVWIGASMNGGSGSAFQGGLDQVVVYRGAVPADELLDRYERVRPPSYVTPDPLPGGKLLVELFYGIPDKPTWDFSIPTPVESYL